MKKIYVGNLPPSVRSQEVKDLFKKYGHIATVDLKNSRGPPFAFIEYEDDRDAEDAVRGRDGYNLDGYSIRVEFPRHGDGFKPRGGGFGGDRGGGYGGGDRGGGGRSGPPSKRGEFRVMVTGLPTGASWQDLKDHMREAGDVGFADVRNGVGFVEFMRYEDMKSAIRKMDDSKMRSHQGDSGYIRVKEERAGGASAAGGGRSPSRSRSRSRSRSVSRSRSRSPPPRRRSSPTYSPMRNGQSRSRSRSRSRS